MVIVLLFECHAGHPQPASCWTSHCCCCWYHYINSGYAAVIPTANSDSWWLLHCVLWLMLNSWQSFNIIACNNVDVAIIIAIIHFLNDACLLSLLILHTDDMSTASDDRHSCVYHFISLNMHIWCGQLVCCSEFHTQQVMICYFYFYGNWSEESRNKPFLDTSGCLCNTLSIM